MDPKIAYIISLKFAPGLKKEFTVIGRHLRRHGFNVRYVISDEYSKLEYNDEGMVFIPIKNGIKGMIFDVVRNFNMKETMKIFVSDPPGFVLFYNPHLLNPRLAYLIKKKFPDVILALYLHDPYKPDKSFYKFRKSAYIKVVEFVQKLTVKYMDYVVSPSKYSSELFLKRYSWFKGRNYIASLLVPDEKVNLNSDRKYFCIVGGAHPATGHDSFVDLVNYVATEKLDFSFCLISSSNMNGFLEKLSDDGRKILRIINKPIIKDSEIYDVVSQSFAVFRFDREVTQSGVIPVSYMNATPVIARNIPGLRQHVWHKETGYLIHENSSPDNIIQAMNYVKENFHELSKNARKRYEDIWAEWNFDRYYDWLIDLLKEKT